MKDLPIAHIPAPLFLPQTYLGGPLELCMPCPQQQVVELRQLPVQGEVGLAQVLPYGQQLCLRARRMAGCQYYYEGLFLAIHKTLMAGGTRFVLRESRLDNPRVH